VDEGVLLPDAPPVGSCVVAGIVTLDCCGLRIRGAEADGRCTTPGAGGLCLFGELRREGEPPDKAARSPAMHDEALRRPIGDATLLWPATAVVRQFP